MKYLSRVFLILFVTTFSAASLAQQNSSNEWPIRVDELLSIQPFDVAQSFNLDMRAEKNSVTNGFLIVIKVDPDLIKSTNAPEPIIYAGNQPVQRLNRSTESGVIIGIIDSAVDIQNLQLWVGRPGLTEQVNNTAMKLEQDFAQSIAPIQTDTVNSVLGQPLQADSMQTLLRTHIAELVLKFSPEEKDLVEAWRLPIVSPENK